MPTEVIAGRLCYVCERVFPSREEARAHLAAEHPGYRPAWRKGYQIAIIDPSGAERMIPKPELNRMLRAARAEIMREAKATPAAEPAKPEPEPAEPASRGPTIDEHRRPFAWQAPLTPPRLARETVAASLPESTLAKLIRDLSAVLSDWDGAGEAGTLSAIEAAQVASLLYDSTLDGIVRVFRGDVRRFRLAIAVAILVLGRGRAHVRAIVAGRATDAAADAVGEITAYQAAEAAPDADPFAGFPSTEPAAFEPLDLIRARQDAWRTDPRAAAS